MIISRCSILNISIVWIVLCIASSSGSAAWQLAPVTDNTVNDRILRIAPNGGRLAWMDQDNSTLNYWDGTTIHPIGTGVFGGFTLDGSSIIYSFWGSSGNYDLYQWQDGVTTQLTTWSKSDSYPVMFDDWYAWMRDYGTPGITNWEIMVFNGTAEQRLTYTSTADQGIAIHDQNVFWLDTGANRVFRYDGSASTAISGVSDYASDSIVQDAWNNHAVWIALYGVPGDDREIAFFDGNTTHRLTDNSVDDYYPRLWGSRVAWMGRGGSDGGSDYEIFLYDSGVITQLTVNDVNDEYPDVSETLVTWTRTVSLAPEDYAAMVFDGTTTVRITPEHYAVEYTYLYEQTVYMTLFDGSDHEIFQAAWVPDPTVTPTVLPTETPTPSPTVSPFPTQTGTAASTATPTPPSPPLPSTGIPGILILGCLIGLIMAFRRRSSQLPILLILTPAIVQFPALHHCQARSIEWSTECADCPPLFVQMRPDSLQLDTAGQPVLACGFDHLYLITNTGASWQLETVDPEPATGLFASLAVDASNQLHISYMDDRNHHLKYARRSGTGWTLTTVDPLPGCGYFTSIELDASGNPHIAYGNNRDGTAGLNYAFFDGAAWHTETIQSDHPPFFTSLAFNPTGEPRIVWQDQYDRKLKYAYRTAGEWFVETVFDQAQCGEDCVLIMDDSGYPHVLYSCDTLRHSWNTGSGWQHETVAGEWAGDMSVQLDVSGNLHAAWVVTGGLKYAVLQGSEWDIETAQAVSGTEVFFGTSLVLDAVGQPIISFCENNTNQLRCCIKQSGIWATEPVASGANVGGSGSAALDDDDDAFVSFTDRNSHRLKFAAQDNGTWRIEEPDPGSLAFHTSIVIDSETHSHIIYQDVLTNSLKYATDRSGSWTTGTIDTNGGSYGALAIDAADTLHAVYFKNSSVLQYAYNPGTAWEFETIHDLTGYSGSPISLCIGTTGDLHLSFYDPVSSTLGYAHRDGSGWNIETGVDPDTDTGYASSIAIDSNGFPRISYCESLNDDNIRLARWSGSAWVVTVIDGTSDWTGTSTSIAIDADNFTHVAYINNTRNIFGYMYETASGWHSGEGVPCGPEPLALMLNSDDRPVVAYHDDLTWDMKVARYQSGAAPTVTPSSPASATPTRTPTPTASTPPTATLTPTPTSSGIPTSTPTSTRTPTPTPTQNPPTATSTPSPTPTNGTPATATATRSPTATPTGGCTTTGVTIRMPAAMFRSGDPFWCDAVVCNADGATLSGYPLFVILDVYGMLFWAPSFNTVFDNYLADYPEFPAGETSVSVLPLFEWPSGAGSASNIRWYGALTNPQMSEIFGTLSIVTFGWE